MSLLTVVPDVVSAASGNLASLGSSLRTANAAAASQTTVVAAPAADEVSAAVTALLGSRAQEFQALSAQASAFHEEFVNLLNGGAAQYLGTEIANAEQTLANAVNTPANALIGHPLIGGGQASVGAAATTADQTNVQNYGPLQVSTTSTATSENITATLTTPFGPLFGDSLNASTFPYNGGLGLSVSGAGTVYSPLGPASFTETGTGAISLAGAASASVGVSTPAGPLFLDSLSGNATYAGAGIGLVGTGSGTLYTSFGPESFTQTEGGLVSLSNGPEWVGTQLSTPAGPFFGAYLSGTSSGGITGVALSALGFEAGYQGGHIFVGPGSLNPSLFSL